MKFATLALAAVGSASYAQAFTILFYNNCPFTIWPAIGKAPNGVPDTSVSYGTTLGTYKSASYHIDDHQLVRLISIQIFKRGR